MSGSLAAVREVWAQRSEARSRSDVLYLVYVVALSLLIIGAPLLQWAGMMLARPDVLPLLLAGRAPQVLAALSLAAAGALVLLGAVRGPALLSPFFTVTLAGSGIRRRDVLWRPFARALLVPVTAAVVPAGVVAAVLLEIDRATPAELSLFLVAALGTGLLLGLAWLAGQLLRPAARRALACALGASAGLAASLPVGIGIGGAYPGRGGDASLWAAGLLPAGLLAVGLGVVLMLDRLRGAVLSEQAARWESATTAATAMDLTTAAGSFRPPPTTGRGLRAIGPGPLAVLYARRDAIAWLRSPERLAVGILVSLLASAAVAGATVLTGPTAWFLVLAGSLGLWAGSAALVDGLRHAVHTLGAPRLFGQTAGHQLLLHTPAPLALMGALAAVGGGAVAALGGGESVGGPVAVLLPLVLVAVTIAGRARDAAKGPMPIALSTPMPTPQGDMSVVLMLGWQSDALVLTALAAALLLALAPSGLLWPVLAGTVIVGALALMTRSRLQALRG